jgi:hypothetical protein
MLDSLGVVCKQVITVDRLQGNDQVGHNQP